MAKKKSTAKKKKTKAPSRSKGLLAKHKRFVEEYLIDLNGRQAAIRAGYSESGASAQACALLKRADVLKALDQAAEERAKRTHADQDRVLEELKWLAYSNYEDYEAANENEPIRVKPGVPKEAMRAVAGVKSKILSSAGQAKLISVEHRLWNKLKALELLMKHMGMLRERIELDHTHRVSIYIPDNGRAG